MPEPTALPLQRLHGQTLHHMWAPKLGRTVVLNSMGQLRLWAMLEAHPGVARYCERPCWTDELSPQPPPDFWALRDGMPVWLVLADEAPTAASDGPAPARLPDVRYVASGELARHRVWIQNWLSLLPYLSMTASLDMASLRELVVGFFEREASFEEVERHLSHLDPVLVRTAVIVGLHTGLLVSADLLVRPWDRHTQVGPLSLAPSSCAEVRFPSRSPTRRLGRASMRAPSMAIVALSICSAKRPCALT